MCMNPDNFCPLNPAEQWSVRTSGLSPVPWRAFDRAFWSAVAFLVAFLVAFFLATLAFGAESPVTRLERPVVAAVVQEAMAESWSNAPTRGAGADALIEEAACAARVAYTETRGVLRGLARKERNAELFRLVETPIRRALDSGRSVCQEAARPVQFTPYFSEIDLRSPAVVDDYRQAARIAVIALTVKSGSIGPISHFFSPAGMPDGKPPYWANPSKGFRVVAVTKGFVFGRFETRSESV